MMASAGTISGNKYHARPTRCRVWPLVRPAPAWLRPRRLAATPGDWSPPSSPGGLGRLLNPKCNPKCKVSAKLTTHHRLFGVGASHQAGRFKIPCISVFKQQPTSQPTQADRTDIDMCPADACKTFAGILRTSPSIDYCGDPSAP